MHSKKITKEEIAEIIKELENLLQPYNPEISANEKPTVVHCGTQIGSGPWKYDDEFMYHFTIKSSKGDFNDGQIINLNWRPSDVAWIIAHEFFMRNDQDTNSPLAKKLWPN